MNTPIVLAALLLGSLAVTGCTPASHSEEADDLKTELEGLPAVVHVRVYYTEPELLDSAKVDLDVTMEDDATPEQVAAVAEAAYDGLTHAHAKEEGNLVIGFDHDKLYLRTFESEADKDDVAAAALAGAVVATDPRRVNISLMTQDVDQSPHVDSTVRLRLPHGTKADEIDRRTESIEQTFGDLPVEVDIRIARN